MSVCPSQEYLSKKLYTNKPTKDYFHQFNTSSRWPRHSLHRLVLLWQCVNTIYCLLYSHPMWIKSWVINTHCLLLSHTYALILSADTDDNKGSLFFIQIVPRTLFFSHISSYSGRFIMQLQLYWPSSPLNSCCSPMIHIDTISPIVLILHPTRHKEAHLQPLPTPLPSPPTQALFKICLLFWVLKKLL